MKYMAYTVLHVVFDQSVVFHGQLRLISSVYSTSTNYHCLTVTVLLYVDLMFCLSGFINVLSPYLAYLHILLKSVHSASKS